MKALAIRKAIENCKRTGNIWGHTTEYVYKFVVPLPFGFGAHFEQRRAGNFMGRFGGGWQFKLGLQGCGSSWIFYYLVGSVWICRRSS